MAHKFSRSYGAVIRTTASISNLQDDKSGVRWCTCDVSARLETHRNRPVQDGAGIWLDRGKNAKNIATN
ncbi:MAG: hypothetical protein WCH62_04965 [Candidatus Omnitrophota bacterium]